MRRAAPLAIALILWLVPLAAAAGNVAIAVMPFRDLSGSKDPVGEAIRESVTSDLRGVQGIRVVERAEISRVIEEQKLQGAELDSDPLATIRLGKLIGADVITLGAYQRLGQRIRLTARFVKVETGEVVGGAKVDGNQSGFLELQDRITVELLKSARLQPQIVARFARRSRPKLKSLRPVELYGRAATEKEAPMKRALLKEAVKAEPQFRYASDELSELEKRLEDYEARARAARALALQKAKAAYLAAKSAAGRTPLLFGYVGELTLQRRYHEALRVMGEALPDAGPDAAALWERKVDLLQRTGHYDQALRDGEALLKKYPEAPQFARVKDLLQRLIDRQRKIDTGKAEAAAAVKELPSGQRWNPCRLATFYRRASQFPQARRLFIACYEADTDDRAQALWQLVDLSLELGDAPGARRYEALLEEESPELHQRMRQGIEYRLAIDD